MQLRQVAHLLDCDVLSGQDRLDREMNRGFAADLMSDVLRFAPQGALLITGLSSAQSIQTAEIADMGAVLLVSNKRPADDALAIARGRNLPLLLTAHGMFEACGLLFRQGFGAPLTTEYSSRATE